MKNHKTLIIRLAVVFSTLLTLPSLQAHSQQRFHSLQLAAPGSLAVKLNISPVKPVPVWIELKDAAGTSLHSQYSSKGGYNGLIDFSKLAGGTYYVQLTREDGLIRRTVLKHEEGLLLLEPEEFIYHFVQIDNKRKLYVRCTSNFSHPLLLRIADRKGDILYEESISTDKSHISKLNLANVPNGTYHVQVIGKTLLLDKEIQLKGGKASRTKPTESVVITAIE